MATNTTLDSGLRWLELGIAVIPIGFRSKLPDANALRWTGHMNNGRASWSHFQESLPTEREIHQWTAGPRINLAVVTGWQDLIVLDFDTLAAWEMYRAWCETQPLARLIVDTTYRVATGRGMHLYVGVEEPVRNGHVGVIDIKAAGGYVLTPPSVHPTGRTYTASDPAAPVLRVERLAEIFPLALDEPTVRPPALSNEAPPPLTERVVCDDPLDSANDVPSGGAGLIERVKAAYRIEDWFRNLTQSGNGFLLTHCPLHDDSSPSFWIDTRRQLCGCYAGCTLHPMDVINLYARMHNLTNNQALGQLAVRLAS